jgi:hypothetical protein
MSRRGQIPSGIQIMQKMKFKEPRYQESVFSKMKGAESRVTAFLVAVSLHPVPGVFIRRISTDRRVIQVA